MGVLTPILCGAACAADDSASVSSASTEEATDETRRPLPPPLIHHVGLNVVDPDASVRWYQQVWPEGEPATVDGTLAFRSQIRGTDPPQDFFHIFNRVDQPPDGAWRTGRYRSVPQSPFWHIGTYQDTTALRSRLEQLGVTTVSMWSTPAADVVWRSGESPYRGMQSADRIADMQGEPPRDGGFGYFVGLDGELLEASGGPQARRGFDHVHLFHEAPWCAARWYIEHLGMLPPAQRNPSTGQLVEISIPEPCAVPVGPSTYPALEPYGTLREPRATVRYGNGTMSAYPRQCRDGRCDDDRPLVSSEGLVLDHIGFLIPALDLNVERLRGEGVRIVEEIHPFGDTRAVTIAGPDGLLLHLVER